MSVQLVLIDSNQYDILAVAIVRLMLISGVTYVSFV
jgi:hypothetical protein